MTPSNIGFTNFTTCGTMVHHLVPSKSCYLRSLSKGSALAELSGYDAPRSLANSAHLAIIVFEIGMNTVGSARDLYPPMLTNMVLCGVMSECIYVWRICRYVYIYIYIYVCFPPWWVKLSLAWPHWPHDPKAMTPWASSLNGFQPLGWWYHVSLNMEYHGIPV